MYPLSRNGEEHQDRTGELRRDAIELFRLVFSARRLDTFANESEEPVGVGEFVAVTIDRGTDLGRVVAKYDPREPVASIAGSFLRKATASDMKDYRDNREFEARVQRFCAERIATRKLDMRLTACEAQLDRKKIRIYFTADQRTDFRGIVRDLASKFHARIEMRQIGVRDDARKKDGVGICGRQLCCSSFLSHFRSITLKNVRDQHLSPNPSKVSGLCSRLMCCLAFETEFYRRAAGLYPPLGAHVKISGQQAEVAGVDIFQETVSLRMEDGTEQILDIEKYHRRRKPAGKTGSERSGDTKQGRTGR